MLIIKKLRRIFLLSEKKVNFFYYIFCNENFIRKKNKIRKKNFENFLFLFLVKDLKNKDTSTLHSTGFQWCYYLYYFCFTLKRSSLSHSWFDAHPLVVGLNSIYSFFSLSFFFGSFGAAFLRVFFLTPNKKTIYWGLKEILKKDL